MMHSMLCTSAPQARSYIFVSDKPLNARGATRHAPRTAITARSKPSVLRVRRDVACAVVSMRPIWIASGPTIHGNLQKALRKRQVWVEPLFAEGKDWHGMRRFRLRRLWQANCEGLMRAAGQNLQRLLKKRGWGRRPYPAEALHAPFLALCGLLILLWRLITAWFGMDQDGYFAGRCSISYY